MTILRFAKAITLLAVAIPAGRVDAQVVLNTAATAATARLSDCPAGSSADQCVVLPSGTEILFSPKNDVTTNTAEKGDVFDMSVVRDVAIGENVVIRRGTPSHGRISWRTGRGVYGKSGKMEFEIVDFVIGGKTIGVTGKHRIEGKGDTVGTIAVFALAGAIPAAFMRGENAVASAGSVYSAVTDEAMVVMLTPLAATAYPAPGAPDAVKVSLQRLRAAISDGNVATRTAGTPSGYCYDVPQGYFGMGTARLPTPDKLTPACWSLTAG